MLYPLTSSEQPLYWHFFFKKAQELSFHKTSMLILLYLSSTFSAHCLCICKQMVI